MEEPAATPRGLIDLLISLEQRMLKTVSLFRQMRTVLQALADHWESGLAKHLRSVETKCINLADCFCELGVNAGTLWPLKETIPLLEIDREITVSTIVFNVPIEEVPPPPAQYFTVRERGLTTLFASLCNPLQDTLEQIFYRVAEWNALPGLPRPNSELLCGFALCDALLPPLGSLLEWIEQCGGEPRMRREAAACIARLESKPQSTGENSDPPKQSADQAAILPVIPGPLTQEELANMFGTRKSTVSRWLKGTPSNCLTESVEDGMVVYKVGRKMKRVFLNNYQGNATLPD